MLDHYNKQAPMDMLSTASSIDTTFTLSKPKMLVFQLDYSQID